MVDVLQFSFVCRYVLDAAAVAVAMMLTFDILDFNVAVTWNFQLLRSVNEVPSCN